ncbi:MAG: LpxL/LpxP family acyltransferase, partial [Terriglobales bacterium]
FTIWDDTRRKYRITFAPRVVLERTGDDERDVIQATQRFTSVIEEYVRKYPEQWLWVHRRWKTRPEGEKPLY